MKSKAFTLLIFLSVLGIILKQNFSSNYYLINELLFWFSCWIAIYVLLSSLKRQITLIRHDNLERSSIFQIIIFIFLILTEISQNIYSSKILTNTWNQYYMFAILIFSFLYLVFFAFLLIIAIKVLLKFNKMIIKNIIILQKLLFLYFVTFKDQTILLLIWTKFLFLKFLFFLKREIRNLELIFKMNEDQKLLINSKIKWALNK